MCLFVIHTFSLMKCVFKYFAHFFKGIPLFLFIYLFIFGCVGSSFLCKGFLQLRQAGATLHRGARASHCRGLSCCGAQAPDAQAQQLWLEGLVAPRHVGSSQTRARTRVPCIGRQILNHCATREARFCPFLIGLYVLLLSGNSLVSFLVIIILDTNPLFIYVLQSPSKSVVCLFIFLSVF